MQSPSSLIFLVLLGIWAAYFVQYWVRRRDHLATARSVDQFSAAMRVLERRDAPPQADVSEPAPRSFAVHPARAADPRVLVERVVADEPTPPVRSAAPAHSTGDHRRRVVPVRPRVRPSRRVRGLFLLTSLSAVLVVAPLVVLAVLPVWAIAPAVVVLGGAVLWVRSGVRAEQAMVRAHRRRQAELARLRSSAPATAPVVRGRGAGGTRNATSAASSSSAAASSAAVASPTAAPSVESPAAGMPSPAALSDAPAPAPAPAGAGAASAAVAGPVVAAAAEPAGDVMVPIVDEDDIPLTWDPVPVPRPTYTMKAKAERREVEPAAVTPDPAPVVRRDDSDATAYDQRRAAGA